MKYICLSFDDGFVDFKNNALPLLKKYGFKSTISIITGFSDRSLKNEFSYLSIEDITKLHNEGFDIAVHSNSHQHKTSIEDFELARRKIISWLGDDAYGAMIPYSQKIDDGFMDYLSKNNYLYVADRSHHHVKRTFKLFCVRLINKMHKTELGDFLVSRQHYIYKKEQLVSSKLPFFCRLPTSRKETPDKIIKLIKNMNNEGCVSIVLHSIVKDERDHVEWPYGAWTCEELECLLRYLYDDKKVVVMTQRELINYAKQIKTT